ncbi:MAG: phosphohydrolase [Clostridiales bacterium]|nr:MAG: phosphohydrolase [Clostridiales bacterium]
MDRQIWRKKENKKLFLWCALFFAALLGVLTIYFVSTREELSVGQVSGSDVQANRYMTVEDKTATKAKEDLALENFEDIYTLNLDDYNNMTLASVSNFFNVVEDIVFGEVPADIDGEHIDSYKVSELKSKSSIELSDADWYDLTTYSREDFNNLNHDALAILSQVMVNSGGVAEENLAQAKNAILAEINNNYTATKLDVLEELFNDIPYYATLKVDTEATETAKAKILATVTPVYRTILKGEMIVSKGQVITEEQYDILYLMGYADEVNISKIAGSLAIILLVLLGITIIYMRTFCKDKYRDLGYMQILMLTVLVLVILDELILSVTVSPSADISAQIGFLLPSAMGTMLVATLFNPNMAVFFNGIFAIFAGILTGDVQFVLLSLISGMVGAIGIIRLTERSDLYKTALYIALINVIAIGAWGILNRTIWDVIWVGMLFGILNGVFSAVLTLGLLPLIESMFGVTTSIKLLELSNPNQPLLKKLMLEAPGTYHHSVMVGNLGEAAAEAVGADGLIVRVGAYYHDIGKIKRPYFFTENQFNGENPHDKISPTLSALIITSHVKDGVEMATEAKLPPMIIDMIAQHHGNSLISYFYQKAKETDEEVREEDYRYEQPKPQTKEAAILMMADTVEAAVRSKTGATPGQIEGFIRTLIKGKLNDGQFDECDLTFKDLDKIAETFGRVINGMYHKRIEYPAEKTMLAAENKAKTK